MEETICQGISWVVGHPLLLSVTEKGQKPIDILRNKNPELALPFEDLKSDTLCGHIHLTISTQTDGRTSLRFISFGSGIC